MKKLLFLLLPAIALAQSSTPISNVVSLSSATFVNGGVVSDVSGGGISIAPVSGQTVSIAGIGVNGPVIAFTSTPGVIACPGALTISTSGASSTISLDSNSSAVAVSAGTSLALDAGSGIAVNSGSGTVTITGGIVLNGSSSGSVGFIAASSGASGTYTWPGVTTTPNYVLANTNGSGVLGWVINNGGPVGAASQVQYSGGSVFASNGAFTSDSHGNVSVNSLYLGSASGPQIVLNGTTSNGGFNLVTTGTGTNTSNGALQVNGNLSFALSNQGIVGTRQSGSAASGLVGEVISGGTNSGAAISLTSNTPVNVASINLTAGRWLVRGHVYFTQGSGTTGTLYQGAITTTSATLPGVNSGLQDQTAAPITSFGNDGDIGIVPVNVGESSTNAVFLVGACTFSGGTMSVYGGLTANRVN